MLAAVIFFWRAGSRVRSRHHVFATTAGAACSAMRTPVAGPSAQLLPGSEVGPAAPWGTLRDLRPRPEAAGPSLLRAAAVAPGAAAATLRRLLRAASSGARCLMWTTWPRWSHALLNSSCQSTSAVLATLRVSTCPALVAWRVGRRDPVLRFAILARLSWVLW